MPEQLAVTVVPESTWKVKAPFGYSVIVNVIVAVRVVGEAPEGIETALTVTVGVACAPANDTDAANTTRVDKRAKPDRKDMRREIS